MPSAATSSWTQPVYHDYFADPFVWRHGDSYYAVGTGAREATGQIRGRIFPVLQSPDLRHWHHLGEALQPPDPGLGDTFWAPAVAYFEGVFYLYYSVGHADRGHHLRVARSSSPRGPYEDTGQPLLDPAAMPFAIDPHPFQDKDGSWYLFFARDFLDCSGNIRAGTALAMRALTRMTQLEPTERVVLRARFDWQRFRAGRPMYGALWDWHTLEGPCLVPHDGHYYCLYSGGCWENETYGVDYAVADWVTGPYIDDGAEGGPRVLRTVPPYRLGPGHNSWISAPDGTEYLVYHAWNPSRTLRQMHVDKFVWTANGPRCQGFESNPRGALPFP